MHTKWIKEYQPSLYQVVINSLHKRRLSHAFLIVGQKDLKDVALWLAAVIMSQAGDDEAIDTQLERLKNDGFMDLIALDGSLSSIKKEEVLSLQAEFSKSAHEIQQQKVGLLHHVENASREALNSLLKSIEEPNDATTFILTTDNLNEVLPTIVSRCLVFNLEERNQNDLIRTFEANGLNNLSAYFLSTITSQADDVDELMNQYGVPQASLLIYDFFANLTNNVDIAIINLQQNTPNDRALVESAFKMMAYAIKQGITKTHRENALLSLNSMDRSVLTKLLEINLETLSKINRFVYVPLLIDQFAAAIREVL